MRTPVIEIFRGSPTSFCKSAIGSRIVEQRLSITLTQVELPVYDKANNNTVIATWMDRLDTALQVSQTVGEQRHSRLSTLKLNTLIFRISFRSEKLREAALLNRENIDGETTAMDECMVRVGRVIKAKQDQRRLQ